MPIDTLVQRGFRLFWTLALAMMVSPAFAQDADTVTGKPEVIDADVLKFGMQRVILWGIDAPEQKQTCQMNGAKWGCHDVAKRRLQLLAGRGFSSRSEVLIFSFPSKSTSLMTGRSLKA